MSVSTTQEEQVLVIPTAELHALGIFNGVTCDVEKYQPLLNGQISSQYLPRAQAEQSPEYKQLIPYCILRRGDLVFHYRRGKKGAENRLHGLRSIGIGGHINPEDGDVNQLLTYDKAVLRELQEELGYTASQAPEIFGLVNDDTTEVGRVHLGVIHVLDIPEDLTQLEDTVCDPDVVPLIAAYANLPQYEVWSQHCLGALFRA